MSGFFHDSFVRLRSPSHPPRAGRDKPSVLTALLSIWDRYYRTDKISSKFVCRPPPVCCLPSPTSLPRLEHLFLLVRFTRHRRRKQLCISSWLQQLTSRWNILIVFSNGANTIVVSITTNSEYMVTVYILLFK